MGALRPLYRCFKGCEEHSSFSAFHRSMLTFSNTESRQRMLWRGVSGFRTELSFALTCTSRQFSYKFWILNITTGTKGMLSSLQGRALLSETKLHLGMFSAAD